jgi:ankyrin repeat protein
MSRCLPRARASRYWIDDVTGAAAPMRTLVDAVRASDVPAVEAALARGADANERVNEDDSDTPVLVIAAGNHDANVVRLLLAAGADIDARAQHFSWSYGTGDTVDDAGDALSRAASLNHVDVVEVLLQHGAKMRTDALVAAARNRALAAARMLLDHGADPGTSTNEPLCAAIAGHADLEMMKLLWEYGARVDVAQPDEPHVVPIELALRLGLVDVARFLIDKGAPLPSEKKLDELAQGGRRTQVNAVLAALAKR